MMIMCDKQQQKQSTFFRRLSALLRSITIIKAPGWKEWKEKEAKPKTQEYISSSYPFIIIDIHS